MEQIKQTPHLALYHFKACPYCAITRNVLKHLDFEVEQRDIIKNQTYRRELSNGGGRQQVPCLRIEADGKVHWLYESRDIINYLKQRSKK